MTTQVGPFTVAIVGHVDIPSSGMEDAAVVLTGDRSMVANAGRWLYGHVWLSDTDPCWPQQSDAPEEAPDQPDNDLAAELRTLAEYAHRNEVHPWYEYTTITVGRDQYNAHTPEGEGWVRNDFKSANGYDVFEFFEKYYFMRRKPTVSRLGVDHG